MVKMKKALSMFLAISMVTGLLGTQVSISNAKPSSYDRGYYGSKLTDNVSIAFYDAMHNMTFSKGEQYVMNYNGMEAGAAAYASGDTLLMQQFGAAVDSFKYDNPGYFYVDWDNLTLNITRNSNGKYQVAIGAGRIDSYLIKNSNIGKQIVDYDAALNTLTAGVGGTTTKEKAKIINDRICEMVNYGFGARASGLLNPEAAYVETAYGALINHIAISDGYAKLYKDALNKLGINCELVSGYYSDGDNTEPRMWNYVQDDDGKWYAVDVTMNDSNAKTNPNLDKYFWKSVETFRVDHTESGYVSSDKYDMPYPTLNKAWATDTNSGLLDYKVTSYKGNFVLELTYDGLDAETLAKEQGLYMAFRTQTTSDGVNSWSVWQSAQSDPKAVTDGGKTYFKNFGNANTSVGVVEVGIFTTLDDANSSGVKYYSKNAEKYNLVEKFSIENTWRNSDFIEPAKIETIKPSNLLKSVQDITQTQKITIKFDKPLKLTNGTKPEISWTVSALNKNSITDVEVKNSAYLDTNSISFDGLSTITFNFTPSTKFEHNFVQYTFSVDNMVNVISKKQDGVALPTFTITYGYEDASVCSKYYNDGRLYVNAVANSAIVSNNDLSIHLWKLEDGSWSVPNQWSQVVVTVTQPTDKDALIDATTKAIGDASAIKGITAFDIDLNICGQRPTIPNGSRVRLCLDYPNGTNPDTNNVVYKLYHFDRRNSRYVSIEALDCIVTPYGLETTIGSCSPYVLVALDANKVKDTSRGVSLDFNGKGGAVSVSTSNQINAIKSGDSVSYTFVPDEGYELEYATLNGVPAVLTGNKAVVSYNDLLDKNNVFSVGFVHSTVKENENNNGVENLTSSFANSIAMKPETPVKDHTHTMQHIVAADDLCTGKASGEYWHCSTCGKNFKDAVGAELLTLSSHTLTTVARKSPTHTTTGTESYKKCTTCNRIYDLGGNIVELKDLTIPAIDHSYDQLKSDANSHWYACSCGATDTKHPHSFDWTITLQPTPTTEGSETGVCSICGYTKTLTIVKSSHTLEHIGAVEATCMHKGTVEYWHCTDCKKDFEDAAGNVFILDVSTPINPENHDGEVTLENEKDPTYTETGYTGDTVCSHCKKIFIKGEVIPKLEMPHEHTLKFVMGNLATCQSQGSKSHYICTGCNRIFEDAEGYNEMTTLVLPINPSVHAKDRVVINNRREATCITQGYAGDVYCGDCGAFMYKGTAIEKTNRHNKASELSHDATSHYYLCKTCGEVIEDTLVAHNGGRATCVAKAICAECGVEYGTIDSTNHEHFDVRKIVAPTSANEGYTGDIYCTDCNADVEKGTSVPKIDHDHNFIEYKLKAPTCHRDGNIAYWECKVCSKLFIDQYGLHEVKAEDVVISKDTHQANIVLKVMEDGHEEVCEVCGEVKVTSHTPHEGGKATCVTKAVCEICGHEYGQFDKTVHENTYVKDHVAATPNMDGYTGDTYCKDCENLVAKGHTISSIGHPHTLRNVPKFEATCERQGNIEHWVCDICGEFFLDVEGKIKVTEADVIIAKLAHTGTGAYTGNANGHWQVCSTCGKDTDRVSHNKQVVNAKEPTTTTMGYSGDVVCKDCGYMIEKGHELDKVTNTPSGDTTSTPSNNTPSTNNPSNTNTSTPSNGNNQGNNTSSIGTTPSNSNKPNGSSNNTIIINSGNNNGTNTNNSGNNNSFNNNSNNNGTNNSTNGNYNNGVQTGDAYTTVAMAFAMAALIACLAFIIFKKKK